MLSNSEATFGKNNNVLLLQSLYKILHRSVKIWTKIFCDKNHEKKFGQRKKTKLHEKKKKKKTLEKLSISRLASLHVTLNTKRSPIHFSIISNFVQSWGFQAVRDEKARMLCDSKATFGKNNNVLILLLQNLYKTSIIQLKFEPKLLSCFLVKTTKRILSEKENQTTCKKKKKSRARKSRREIKEKLSISRSSSLQVTVVTLNTKSIPIHFSIISSFVQSWGF